MSYQDSDEPFVLNIGSTKPFLSLDEQIDLLQSRGLIINNREQAKSILKRTNYYRLSAYSLTKRTNDVFDVNVSFDDIYTLYRFDDADIKMLGFPDDWNDILVNNENRKAD